MRRPQIVTAIAIGALLLAREAYVRRRRVQLRFMPKGINDSRGVTMAAAIRGARPLPANR